MTGYSVTETISENLTMAHTQLMNTTEKFEASQEPIINSAPAFCKFRQNEDHTTKKGMNK